jgi:hypothetical protein
MTGAWDAMWVRFREVVDLLNESLGVEEAGLIVRVDRHANEGFPFRAWASYSPASSPGDEQLVLSLDFKRDGSEVLGQIDIARGDGLVLAEQQILEPIEELSATAGEAIRDAGERMKLFVMRIGR